MKKVGASITLILIIINSLFFLITLPILYKYPDAINYIALKPSAFLQGKYLWTIFTNMFMHAGAWHLIMNMVSLVFLGSFAERIIGKKRFLALYIIAGLFAGIFFVFSSLLFKQDYNALAVGASGAIFGIAGLIAVLTPKLPVYIMFIPIATPMWLAVIILIGVLWLLSLAAGLNIGNTAHLGGLIVGLAYGFYLRARHKRKIKMLNRMLIGNH